jgi:hypothetical protein
MTRKEAIRHERSLRARGVYKPYVSMDGARLLIESYPLTAAVSPGPCDPELGPIQCVKVTDCTLPRIGEDSTVTTFRVFLGQDLLARVAESLLSFHGPAHARAIAQEDAMTMPWCEPCQSYHVMPQSRAHHAELQCKTEYGGH